MKQNNHAHTVSALTMSSSYSHVFSKANTLNDKHNMLYNRCVI